MNDLIIDSSQLSDESYSSNLSEEDKLLGGYSPFYTILMLSIGPLLFTVTHSLQDAIDLYFIGKVYGDPGVTTIGIASAVRIIIATYSGFAGLAIPVKISSLIAEKRIEEGSQLVMDMIRVGLLIGIIFPIIFYFLAPPFLLFMGMPNQYIHDSTKYIYCVMIFSGFLSIYQFLAAALIGEAKSTLSGMVQLVSLCISLLIFDPVIIFLLKAPVWTLGFAFSSGLILGCLYLVYHYMNGSYALKPSWSMFLNPFSESFYHTLSLSIPFCVTIMANIIPAAILLRYINLAGQSAGLLDQIATIASSLSKPYSVIYSVGSGLLIGLSPAASYAYTSKKYSRLKSLFYSSLILPTMVFLIGAPLMIFKSDFVMKIWINDPLTLQIVPKFVPKAFFTLPLSAIIESASTLLLSTNHNILALYPPFARAIGLISGTLYLYNTDKTNPFRIVYAYLFQDSLALIVSLCCLIIPFREISDGENDSTNHSALLTSIDSFEKST